MNRLGAVIIFKPGMTRDQAQRALRTLEADGVIDGEAWVAKRTPVESFDDRVGGPVWYVP